MVSQAGGAGPTRGRPWRSLAAVAARISALDAAAYVYFVFTLVAIWTQVQPFSSLRDYAALDDATQSNTARKLVTIGLVCCGVGLVALRGRLAPLARTATLPLGLVMCWFAFTSLHSPASGLALNRLALAGAIIVIAATLPLAVKSLDDCVNGFGAAVSIVIVVSVLGAILAPDIAIHTARDVTEQTLAGNWRGVFPHKNELAAMSNFFLFVGLLVARVKNMAWGVALAAAALALMTLSGGKSALLLIAPTLAAAWIVVRARAPVVSLLAAAIAVGGMALMTLGGVAFPEVAAFTAAVMPDPTFTGRTDIWSLAMDGVDLAPIFGHGYETFWDTSQVQGAAETGMSTATFASHAHNGYLDTALSGGLPGLALVLVWTAAAPWRAIERLKLRPADATETAFLDFLAQCWLFGLMISCLESVLFNRGNASWFTMLIAICALRQWGLARGIVK